MNRRDYFKRIRTMTDGELEEEFDNAVSMGLNHAEQIHDTTIDWVQWHVDDRLATFETRGAMP